MNNRNCMLENDSWKLEIQHNGNNGYVYKLISKVQDTVYADQDYHYSLLSSNKKELPIVWINLVGGERDSSIISYNNNS